MSNSKISRKPRGEQRFASITYSLLAKWTGLSLQTVRSYASRGLYQPGDLAGTIAWVNARRAERGLEPIGATVMAAQGRVAALQTADERVKKARQVLDVAEAEFAQAWSRCTREERDEALNLDDCDDESDDGWSDYLHDRFC